MINDDTRRTGHHGRPPSRPHTDDTLSVERPGSRRMRGLGGRIGGHGHGRPHGGRFQMRRGIIRDAILGLLAEQPMHGYQVMQELSERSGGRWHPSAGSIYPTLQQLEDEGLIGAQERDGRRVFELTDAGKAAVEQLSTERPWANQPESGRDLHRLAREVGMAAQQVGRMGTSTSVEAAATILTAARRDLYRLLAEDPSPETASDAV